MHIISYFFILVMSFSIIKGGALSLYYMIDTEGFIENFCINKDKTTEKCHGKCQLKENSKQNEKSVPQDKVEIVSFHWIDTDMATPSLDFSTYNEKTTHQFFYLTPIWENSTQNLWQPPI